MRERAASRARRRREEVERTPVWFMRQAGRSLPEYRAIRAKHAFFEVAHTPELCAEVTLQPVRRHDVDAAVMFADIMTPVLGMGIDVRLVEGVGPVIDEPVRTLADVERLRVPDPEEAFAPVLEAVRLVRAALRPDQAVVGFCGGPFTVAGLSRRGEAEPRVRADEEPDARPARGLARAPREAVRDVRRLRRREGARRRGRDPALRLLGGRALAGAVPRPRRAALGARPRGGRRADDPLRHRHGDAARGDGGGRRRRDRPRLADPARCRAGRRFPIGQCRGTSTRPCCSRRGTSSRRRRSTSSRVPEVGPGTSSTSGTASSRPSIPTR